MDAVRRRRRQFATRMRNVAAKAQRPDLLKSVVSSILGSTVAIVCFGIYAIHLGTHATASPSAPASFFAGYKDKIPAKAVNTFKEVWWNVFLYLPTGVACLTTSSTSVAGIARTIITLVGTGLTLIFFVKSVDIGLLVAAVSIYVFVSNRSMPARVASIGTFATACATEVIKLKA